MHARMCERVHLIHHQRGYVIRKFWFKSRPNDRLPKCRGPASEKCQQEKRKTVNGEDILFAMTSLGFENYAEALKIYLAKYREVSFVFWIISPPHLSFVTFGQNEPNSEHRTDWDETQSARGENQNRPTSSSGTGGYTAGGPVGGTSNNSAAAAAAAAQSSVFNAGQPETAGAILSPTHGLDTSDHDGTASYVYPGMVSTGHNGTGAESY